MMSLPRFRSIKKKTPPKRAMNPQKTLEPLEPQKPQKPQSRKTVGVVPFN
jgi:hypothetical protein